MPSKRRNFNLSPRQKLALGMLATYVGFVISDPIITIVRLNVEKWAEENKYDQLYRLVTSSPPEALVTMWELVTGLAGVAFVAGVLFVAFVPALYGWLFGKQEVQAASKEPESFDIPPPTEKPRPDTRLRIRLDASGTGNYVQDTASNIHAWQQAYVRSTGKLNDGTERQIYQYDCLAVTFEDEIDYERPISDVPFGVIPSATFLRTARASGAMGKPAPAQAPGCARIPSTFGP